ncbi:oxidoreductase [Providencia vermicola]|uniref:Oxidoreductase n=1 Tax=Providencia stuartii TaxID=588 RepID=A0ABD5L4M7_PROST|nr:MULTISPECIES: oxidoreductase [Providencia]ELR5043619.1 oxidoreductase [Providencia rettgeri]ELR5290984.1 oxidoreductase [Providencia stuartii]MCR4182306.1 oxidoreductase [Providencia vermicola]MTB40078.1 oxidoreductase [Providencia sp. wls1949]MTC09792.1 oxidoreductase [Providencia sp. wls1948]
MSAPIKVGIIGYGYASKTFHAPFIATLPGYELTAISSSQPDKVTTDWPNVTVVSSPEQLLANPEIELVIIPTPNDTHYPLASQALAAGKHVVVDKPFTVTVEEAEALQQQAQKAGKILSVYHNRRWDAGFLTLKQLFADGCLGDIKYYESHFDRYRPVTRQRWRESAVAGGGIWYDLGPHLLDQALQFFGKPTSIHADLAMIRPNAEAVDYFHVLLNYADKKVILHATTVAAAESPLYVVHGMKGSYVKYGLDSQEDKLKSGALPNDENWGVDERNGVVTLSQGDELISKEWVNKKGHYGGYYLKIFDAIRHGAENPVQPQEAIEIMKLIEAGIISAKEKRTVDIDF